MAALRRASASTRRWSWRCRSTAVWAKIVVPVNCDKETAIQIAKDNAAIAEAMPIREIRPGRLVNIVIK
ncbi:MAG: hypothetical protein ACLUIR_11195 [Faecalibacterium prausnitzii]